LQRSGELTIKTAEGHSRVNPLVRIASQAMADMQRIGAQFGLTPSGAAASFGNQAATSTVEVRWVAWIAPQYAEPSRLLPHFACAQQLGRLQISGHKWQAGPANSVKNYPTRTSSHSF
jgi:hypothetical protein